MFNITGNTTGGIIIIFIVLLGCLFLCQTLGKLIMWLVGRFKHTTFTGADIIEELKERNHLGEAKVKTVKFNFLSSFYSYRKNKNEFVLGKRTADLSNVATDAYALQAMTYADEQQSRKLGMTKIQLISDALLSLVPYLFLMGILLLVYLPVKPDDGGTDWWTKQAKYNITVQAMAVVGWVIMLVCLFWWMSIVQDMSGAIDELARQTTDQNLINQMSSYLKVCSYIPFSFRTVI